MLMFQNNYQHTTFYQQSNRKGNRIREQQQLKHPFQFSK